VLLRQPGGDGPIHCEVHGEGDITLVERQVRRILSLDHPGAGWLELADRDPVIGRLQAEHPGLRPVLFHSPYEGAAWSVISHRRQKPQSAKLRTELGRAHGRVFDLDGEEAVAFPTPTALAALDGVPGIEPQRLERLHGVAAAALDGTLDPDQLARLPEADAYAAIQRIPGLGPFYSGLVLVRSTGLADILPSQEATFRSYLRHYYELDHDATDDDVARISDTWRPYRTWATVLIRVAGDRAGLAPPRRRAPRRAGARA
jgi:DNA-3-methyladenine glycosylase II